MAILMDPSFPPDFKPFVPLLAVAMAYPNQAEQAQQVVPKANPPLPPSQAAADLEVETARAEAISAVNSIFANQAPAQQAPAQQAAPARTQPARARTLLRNRVRLLRLSSDPAWSPSL